MALDDMSYEEQKELYIRSGELMALVGQLVETLFADDQEFTSKFRDELEHQIGTISEERKILLHANLTSKRGKHLLSLLRDTSMALLQVQD